DFHLDPAGRLSGRVVDKLTSGPVAGAIVRAEADAPRPHPLETTTDSRGRFHFTDLNPGQYQLSAGHDTRVGFHSGRVVVTSPGSVAEVTIALEPAFWIGGRVAD